ncbi:hypothetical protein [Armatimonas sp.]
MPRKRHLLTLCATAAPIGHDEAIRRLGQATALLLRAANRRQGREKHLL